ncbi:MAG: transglutaminase domain-containing protein [Muribaculaceae bacterium]|nr:transglutaminase domain-containing protein [Muribaculaceae bacterium]
MRNIIIGLCGLLMVSCSHSSHKTDTPAWLEADSAAAIQSRLESDFSLTFDSAARLVREKHPELSDSDIMDMISKKYMEAKTINGELRFHRKSPRNLNLLCPAYNGGVKARGETASDARIAYVDSVISWYKGTNKEGLAHKVKYRFSIDVPYHEALDGDTLRVWMPLPLESERQSEISILGTEPAEYLTSSPETSVHNTVYLEKPVVTGQPTHFECTVEFVTSGAYFSPEYILNNIKDYDRESELYKKYTSTEAPHIIRLDSLAHAIVGDSTDPYECSEKVYDYIINRYPWAGAREYSTISCIPEYVVREGHGDCGQVSLLYISLMRSLGIPARWESGWMLHPGEKNLHDWAEVYFEGVGWVPVDVSFGRYVNSGDKAIEKFYSTGMDAHRLASNKGVCGKLYPPKRYVRSETVDFQLGEVESSKGNLFYPGWDSHMELISVTPINIQK